MPAVLAFAFLFLVAGPAAWASAALPDDIDFKVYRDGEEIGHHRVTFSSSGNDIVANVDIELSVRFAGIRVFHYKHDSREIWRDGTLAAIDSVTNNDGEDMSLTLRRDGEALSIDGTKYQGAAAATLVPTSYWFKDTIKQSQIIDSQNGRIFPVVIRQIGRETVEAGGMTVAATRYTLQEQLTMNLWYDDQGRWVKTSFESDGSLIDYVLQPREQQAAAN